jgi:hypothetical protein
LTLRTLLAYLDDTLEPAQAKVIGQKIAESSTAQELITRIKEVVRRRRLTTPPSTGPEAKLDPNTIAEYIDNALPSDQLAKVEEACLDSDVYLAEVAACHQILTVILSEPALVPPTARQRMYGLVRGREAIPYRKADRVPPANGTGIGPMPEREEADEALLLGLPLYPSQGSWWRRLVPILGVLALVAVLALALWQVVPPFAAPRPGGSGDNLAQAAPPSGDNALAPAPNPANEPKDDKANKPNEANDTGDQKPPAPAPAPGPAGDANVKEPQPAKEPEPIEEDDKAPSGPAKPTAPKNDRRAIGKFMLGPPPAVLLSHPAEGKGQWQRVGRDAAVHTTDQLVSLPGYRCEIRLDSGVHLLLWGNLAEFFTIPVLESAVVLHVPPPDFDADFTLEAGRVVLSNHKAEGEAKARLRFHDQVWDISLLDGDSELALELWGIPTAGFKKDADPPVEPAAQLYLINLKGQANVKARGETYLLREHPGAALFSWNNAQGAMQRPMTMKELPAWATAGKLPPKTKPAQAMLKAMDVLSERLGGKEPVDVILPELVKDPDPLNRLSVYCLAATDELPGLLDALADEQNRLLRVSAINALAHWIGRSPDRDMKLYHVLEKKFKAGPAEIVMSLLHGFTKEQQERPETYEALIEYLKNDKLSIRELAAWRLASTESTAEIARRIPYEPADGTDQRQRAYEEWKKLVPDGQLPPKKLPPRGKDKRNGG